MKVKVLYILSTGHSGSTLMSKILASSKNCFSVGELKYLREILLEDREAWTCDDGNKLTECAFWAPVINGVNPSKLFRLDGFLKESFRSLSYLLYTPHLYNSEEDNLYQNMLKQSKKIKGDQVVYIVDNSKSIRRLLYLKNSPEIEVKVLRLARDGRGVVNSFEKHNCWWLRVYLEWLIGNFLRDVILKRHFKEGEDCLRMSYDFFARDYLKYIKKINDNFGLKLGENSLIDDVNMEELHHFTGHRDRKKRIDSIKRDEGWKRKMPAWKSLILTLLTYIPNKVWVYNNKLR